MKPHFERTKVAYIWKDKAREDRSFLITGCSSGIGLYMADS